MNEKLQELNASTAAEISTRVPIDMHPDAILGRGEVLVDEGGGPGQVAYTAGRNALRSMYDSLREIENAAQAQQVAVPVGKEGRVRMEIPQERRAALGSAMAARFESAATAVARQEQAVVDAIDKFNEKIAQATTHPNRERASVVQAASEIRGHVKSMRSSSERLEFVRKAIEEGDLEIASAVLQTSCYSSGFSRQEFDIVRGMAEAKFAPRESKQRAAALAVKSQLEKAQGSFLSRYVDIVPKMAPSKADVALQRLKGGR